MYSCWFRVPLVLGGGKEFRCAVLRVTVFVHVLLLVCLSLSSQCCHGYCSQLGQANSPYISKPLCTKCQMRPFKCNLVLFRILREYGKPGTQEQPGSAGTAIFLCIFSRVYIAYAQSVLFIASLILAVNKCPILLLVDRLKERPQIYNESKQPVIYKR